MLTPFETTAESAIASDEIPIHSELFSIEQLEAHARMLAATHSAAEPRRVGRPLLPRLDHSIDSLETTYQALSAAALVESQLRGSEAWLRDNFYVVQDQVREIRQDLPRKYYDELPKLVSGPWQGYPRVYQLALEFVPRTASRFDAEGLVRFVSAYQETVPLSIGEIWAMPIMLRFALVETLRRLAERVMTARRQRADAVRFASELAKAETQPRARQRALDRRSDRALSPAFVVELLEWLRDQPSTAAPVWDWLRQTLESQSDDSEEMIRREHQREAADQLAIANTITTMRLMSSLDWQVFFERVSLLERALRQDPSGAYAEMDFPTRDRYRRTIEQLARRSGVDEIEVGRRALAHANRARTERPHADREHHVGYYLISRGRFALEADVGYRPRLGERLGRFAFRHPAIGYLGSIALLLTLSIASLLSYAFRRGGDLWDLALVALFCLVPISELAIGVVNRIFTSLVHPRPLPKLALRDGIPASARTMVVVPTMLTSRPGVDRLIEDVEVRYLANRDEYVHFALLTDFRDAASESLPDDDELLAAARAGITQLNERYGHDRFFLLHRRRQWNEEERLWMGWERKRGKLMEFNRVLRGATDTSFSEVVGAQALLPSVKYVITLDTDTQLPLDMARQLVGTASHPLNRPRFDPALRRVTAGYGILQPRVGVSAVSASRTSFSRVFSGEVGLDPYTTAVSDVYQDLFHEGIFVGKGLYDVDAFGAALENRVPQNTLLSHDLFEGLFARVALCTDLTLIDEYPPHYPAFAMRLHRWVRGDWQIARWLWRTVPDALGRPVRNTLPAIARWKILDNLRRSLLAPSLVVLLAAAWTTLPGSVWLWTGVVLMVLGFPLTVSVGQSLGGRVHGVPIGEHLRAERDQLLVSVRQMALSIAFLAHQGALMLDAVVRTIVRMTVTRHKLLEWESAASAARLRMTPTGVLRRMWAAPAIAAALWLVTARIAPLHLLASLPFVLAWAASPFIAYRSGTPSTRGPLPLSNDDRALLRQLARRTWRFFEEFVVAADHFLVPDNYQEDRQEPVAHRTSPTNIGLQLLASVSAYDLGYLGGTQLLTWLERTFSTLTKMPRYRGHFYNWYDTRTLELLPPAYVSTVDTGNCAAALMTLRQALVRMTDRDPILGVRLLRGTDDGLALFAESLDQSLGGGAKGRAKLAPIRRTLSTLREHLQATPTSLSAWSVLLGDIGARLVALGTALDEIEEDGHWPDGSAGPVDARFWLERVTTAISDAQAELASCAPWVVRPSDFNVTLPFPTGVPSIAFLHAWHSAVLAGADADRLSPGARTQLTRARDTLSRTIERSERLAMLADDFVEEIDFSFLFDPQRHLFAIGYNASEGRRDESYYDLLASEARLATFVAIATGKLSPEAWFKLGRTLAPAGEGRALLSWSASMFEYLMPILVMRSYPGTLLHETYLAVVRHQIAYGTERGVPWGISESAYNTQDQQRNYQYRAFGVPGLGLKRGLGDDLVVAPYATVLATPVTPAEAARNLRYLISEGLLGPYGLFEAIDYTPERRGKGERGVVLRTFMAHHQGMSLIAIDNSLCDDIMALRFHSDPRVQAAELLLQERVPRLVPLHQPPVEHVTDLPAPRGMPQTMGRRYTTAQTLSPRSHLLSNGAFSVMVTNAGGGFSAHRDVALTRWRRDITCDPWGMFLYVRDLASGEYWSTADQPTGRVADAYEVIFTPDRASFRRRDGDIELHTEIVVSPEDNAEIRRISVTNHSGAMRDLDITSYAEVLLTPLAADEAHPAFSNLFVDTTSIPERDALICTRRSRDTDERRFLVHVLAGTGRMAGPSEFDTSRGSFIGRGGSTRRPAALEQSTPLAGTSGPVLDPIVSLRHRLRLPPGVTARVTFTTGYADSEEDARRLIEKFHDRRAVARAIALAGTHAQIELRYRNLTLDDVNVYQRFGARLTYNDPRLRQSEAILHNQLSQSELWKHGISGDLPIVVASIADWTETPLVRDVVKAHEYLRLKGFRFELVILNEHSTGYRQDLHDDLRRQIEASPSQQWLDHPGGIFLRRADLLDASDRRLLFAVAAAHLIGARGNLRSQLSLPLPSIDPPLPFEPTRLPDPADLAPVEPTLDTSQLAFFNGYGGFTSGGREYVTIVRPQQRTPAPYAHVVSTAEFGFVATESGPGCTWSGNSRLNRLTPWSNDPVTDPAGEAVFLRDEEMGQFWSATPHPSPGTNPYVVRYGPGYAAYEHSTAVVHSNLLLFVSREDPVKIARLRVSNKSSRRRTISATFYLEWVLGDTRTRSTPHVATELDPETGALLARNAFRIDFSGRVAFLHANQPARSWTADRTSFVGRNGTLSSPAAMRERQLTGDAGAAYDPCAAIQVTLELNAGEEQELIFQLGEARDVDHMREIVARHASGDGAQKAFDAATDEWSRRLGTITVRTPDPAADLILNQWLLYQTLACRFWGRSAFYQSSGAFGFRDQLQDVLALLPSAPELARAHILHAASRQFREGDVQHWWHAPRGQGVRTRFADDRLWLPYAALTYAGGTGDWAIFDESVSFLEGRPLKENEHEAYEQPTTSAERAPLFEHCVRAVDLSLATGPHGLPLMGGGDWNDGMNRVGQGGTGESVWLGWFACTVLPDFAALCEQRGDHERAQRYRDHAAKLKPALEQAWDGEWYRRAYFDDGTPLGSATNTECRIDAIAQAWAVISDAGDHERARTAMASVERLLIRHDDRLILLLDPPFEHMTPDPGYIKAYPPGIRENGGQYTHAALWVVMAFARMGDGTRAHELFSLLNPVGHGMNPQHYLVEPYVIAADVYSRPPHVGRGGWTWYTGSAGWMYRVGIEELLGLRVRGNTLVVDPCIPPTWARYEATVRRGRGVLQITVENPDQVTRGVTHVELDGAPLASGPIPLPEDDREHHVRVVLGR